MSTILIFERSNGLRGDLTRAVRGAGYQVDAIGDPRELEARINELVYCAALVEVSNQDDLHLLRRLGDASPDAAIFAMGAAPSIDLAVAAIKNGARDYLRKPFRIDVLERSLSAVLDARGGQRSAIREREFLTNESAVADVVQQAGAASTSDATVLILGENGTGKKTLAEKIHKLSPRRRAPFVAIDCASLSDIDAERELFGETRPFANAQRSPSEGKLALVHGGTLLLDEVGEASPAVQALLMRMVEEREFSPVGASVALPVDCRVIATSRLDLGEKVALRQFREDLFYRLDVVVLSLPALRERKGDINLLADDFLARYSEEAGCGVPQFSDEDRNALCAYPFRGNVRELDNLMQRAVIMFPDRPVELERLLSHPGTRLPKSRGNRRSLNLRELEREAVERSLSESNGNRTHASQLLGINVRTLRNKIRAYGLV
jgi:DNA-binding NtrC family response regulator